MDEIIQRMLGVLTERYLNILRVRMGKNYISVIHHPEDLNGGFMSKVISLSSVFCFMFIFLFVLVESEAQEKKVEPQALEVSVYKVGGERPVTVELQYPGRTKSVSKVTVVARVTGILKERYFVEGQFVKKDDPLFKIEPDIYQAEYDSAMAMVMQSEAELNKAERDYERIKIAFEDRVASEQQMDAALSAYEQAKARLALSRARLKQAEVNLKYTDVNAPVSGITGARLVDIGNMVSPGTPLVTITEMDPIYVEFSIPDTDMKRIFPGKKTRRSYQADLLIDGKTYNHKGQIDFIDIVIDERTSSVHARALFPNPEGVLMPGQFVRIRLKGLPVKKAITIPERAILQTPQGASVYVVENGMAVMRPIRTGDRSGEDIIIEEGLKHGDIVIVDNLMKLRPGMPVRVSQEIRK